MRAHFLGRAAPYIPMIPNINRDTPTTMKTCTMTKMVFSSSDACTYWLIKKSSKIHKQNPKIPPPNN